MRFFAEAVEAKALLWRKEPVEQVRVVRSGRFGGTTDGACLVALPCGMMSWLKPRAADNLTVAREKIASDIGYELGLPVAPVLVKPACDNFQHACSLSLVSLSQPRPWGAGSVELRTLAAEPLEALRVFWTWIGETDHEGNHENLLYERQGDVVKLVSIDHGRCLGHGVTGSVLAFGSALGYGTADLDGAKEARDALVDRIESMPEPMLKELVGRLRVILTEPQQGAILDLLRQRRDGLRDLLDVEG